MTNLNEDVQLSGKLYYSLANLATEQFTIGRSDDNQIILRGVGIQKSHAEFKIDKKANILLVVRSSEAHEQTLVNGE